MIHIALRWSAGFGYYDSIDIPPRWGGIHRFAKIVDVPYQPRYVFDSDDETGA
jgi:hypothetical protein